jgi:hypothetical protein
MTYRFIYSQSECNRIIPAVLIDKRASIDEIKNKAGSIIKAFTDQQVSLVTDTTIFYKIETDQGNLAGYFTLQVIRTGVVAILQYELRPAFVEFDLEISGLISNFIRDASYQQDYLF